MSTRRTTRRTKRRTGKASKKTATKKQSSEMTKLKRQVRRITKSIEHKSHYKNDEAQFITGNLEVNLDPIGSFDLTQVEGQKITASTHSFNLKLEYLAANDIVYSKWRVMVVVPKAEVALILADVLQQISNEYIFQSGYKSQDIPDNKKYSVLMDKVFTLNSRNPLKILKFNKRWNTGKVITLNNEGVITSSLSTNDYRPQVLFYCMTNVNGSGSSATAYLQSKIRYTDL
jgi:hypothetical protein